MNIERLQLYCGNEDIPLVEQALMEECEVEYD